MSEALSAEAFPARKPRRDDVLAARFDGLTWRGETRGRARGGSPEGVPADYEVIARAAVPGDEGNVLVRRRSGARLEAELVELTAPSPDRVAPRCRHFASCGGCSFQDLAYARQLVELHALLARTLAPLGAALPAIGPVIGCEEPWAYRNKMDFNFGSRRWVEPDEVGAAEVGLAEVGADGVAGAPERPLDFALGLHVPGRYDKILDILACEIAFPEANGILATARAEALARGLAPWDVKTHTGLLRHLVLRKSFADGTVLANLVTSEQEPERLEPFARALAAAHPELVTCVQTTNSGVALVASGEERLLFGPGWIEERLCGLAFRVSARSFFQTNTVQAERLAALVAARAQVRPGEVLFDVYCGGGALALVAARALAGRARAIVGFESVPEAVRDAEHNALQNGIAGARFLVGDVARTLAPEALAAAGLPMPDVVVVDPPRAGVAAPVLAALAAAQPRRIVYVSCNPTSSARDLPTLLAAGYALEAVDPIDLFPHTPHLECVFSLARAGAGA